MSTTDRPRLVDVARASGYSVCTVSRALAGKAESGRISPSAVRAIRRTAARLGYARDDVAHALRTRSTRMLGLVVSDIANPFFGRVASLVQRAAEGYRVLVCNTSEDPKLERASLAALEARRVDGVLISPDGRDPSAARALERQGTAVVTFDREYAGGAFDSVVCNNRETASRLTLRLGKGRLGFVGGALSSSTHSERLRGFRDASEGPALCGAEPDEAARRMLRLDGVLFANSLIAEGVLSRWLRGPRDRIPRLASFDDSPLFSAVPVTVAIQPEEKMARTAVELLLRRIRSPRATRRRIVLRQTVREGS